MEASSRLYTWPHRHAAEMICGYVSDDVFTDWRSWVIAMGRDTFERIAENPDRLADVEDLSGGREGAAAEWFGSAVSEIWFARYGYEREDFPILEPSMHQPVSSSPIGRTSGRRYRGWLLGSRTRPVRRRP